MTKELKNLLGSLFGLALVVFVLAYNNMYSKGDLVWKEGLLIEVNEYSFDKRKGIQLILESFSAAVRIGPKEYRKFLKRSIPKQLVRGAEVSILVSESEYKNPNQPILASDLTIVWVHGLKIENELFFGELDMNELDKTNNRWGFLLLLFFLASVGWTSIKYLNYKRAL